MESSSSEYDSFPCFLSSHSHEPKTYLRKSTVEGGRLACLSLDLRCRRSRICGTRQKQSKKRMVLHLNAWKKGQELTTYVHLNLMEKSAHVITLTTAQKTRRWADRYKWRRTIYCSLYVWTVSSGVLWTIKPGPFENERESRTKKQTKL